MNASNHHRRAREFGGAKRHFYEMRFEDRTIWGATAGIIRQLYERMVA
jgi:hypothetical protein